MLKENWISSDLLTVNNINEILDKLYNLLYNIGIDSPIMVGVYFYDFKWIYTSDLNYIENYIVQLCNYYGIKFEKKYWDNMDGISYKDINRWCIAINLCEMDYSENKKERYVSEYNYIGDGFNI